GRCQLVSVFFYIDTMTTSGFAENEKTRGKIARIAVSNSANRVRLLSISSGPGGSRTRIASTPGWRRPAGPQAQSGSLKNSERMRRTSSREPGYLYVALTDPGSAAGTQTPSTRDGVAVQ